MCQETLPARVPLTAAQKYKGPVPVSKVAAHIRAKAGEPIDEQKMRYLLYYAQAWSLAITGKPLFIEDMFASSEGIQIGESLIHAAPPV